MTIATPGRAIDRARPGTGRAAFGELAGAFADGAGLGAVVAYPMVRTRLAHDAVHGLRPATTFTADAHPPDPATGFAATSRPERAIGIVRDGVRRVAG